MTTMGTETALLIAIATAAGAWVMAALLRAAHLASQPLGFKYGFGEQRGTAWEALRKVVRLAMWCALAAGALSLVLNVIRFAKT